MRLTPLLPLLSLTSLTHAQLILNKLIKANILYRFPKIGWLASRFKTGAGVYACTLPNFTGSCHWHDVISPRNSYRDLVGKCILLLPTYGGSIGPDEGLYCAAFHGRDTCNWYASQPPNATVPSPSENAVALIYPGVKDLNGIGFRGGDVWGYCFRGDSGHNPCTSVWGPWCS